MSLYQKDVRYQKGLKVAGGAQKTEQTGMGENLHIGFCIMKVSYGCRYFNIGFRGKVHAQFKFPYKVMDYFR